MNTTKNINVFQVASMAIFLVIGVLGIVLFATSKVGTGSKNYTSVVWGVLPQSTINTALESYRIKGIDPNFTYTEFPEEGFDQVILQAVAEGRGPDAIIFPDTMYFGQFNKLVTIPSETISSRAYTEKYIDAAKQFSVQGGVKAFPLVIDPLVMYYNKDMFTAAGILTPPKSWREVSNYTTLLTRKRDDGVIDRSGIALGEYANINHAKNILYTLLTQAGVRVSFFDTGIQAYTTGLSKTNQASAAAGEVSASEKTKGVMTYFTNFANPLATPYTWNRSFSSSRDAFLSQSLAMYIGPGSELQYIISRNPNLNFGIAPIPQENPDVKAVQGKSYALGFLITSRNLTTAYTDITEFFTADTMIQGLADALHVAPATRSLIASSMSAKNSADLAVIYESAIYAQTWMDPNESATDTIFKTLVESVTSGKQNLSEAIQDAGDRLDRLYILK